MTNIKKMTKLAELRPKKIENTSPYFFSKSLVVKEDYSVFCIINRKIHTAKRKSDGQSFSINDEVYCKFTNKSHGRITKIYQLENQLRCRMGMIDLCITGASKGNTIVTTPY